MLHLFEFHNNGLILYTVFHDDIEIEPLTAHAWGAHHPIHQFVLISVQTVHPAEWLRIEAFEIHPGPDDKNEHIHNTYSDFVYLHSYKILVS